MTYKHDMLYYGSDVICIINRITKSNPVLDRGGVYIWVNNNHVIYLNVNENDHRGSLEIHYNGCFVSQIDYNGILDLNSDSTDCVFNAEKVRSYLIAYINSVNISNYLGGMKYE